MDTNSIVAIICAGGFAAFLVGAAITFVILAVKG